MHIRNGMLRRKGHSRGMPSAHGVELKERDKGAKTRYDEGWERVYGSYNKYLVIGDGFQELVEGLGKYPCGRCGGELRVFENVGVDYGKCKQYMLECKNCGGRYGARNILPEEWVNGKFQPLRWGE